MQNRTFGEPWNLQDSPILGSAMQYVCNMYDFLATLVALHFTPVSKSVSGRSFGLQPSSVAWSLRACWSKF